MGGFHVKYRKTNQHARYIGISSQLKLPLNLNGDSVVEAYPEFFHGFYQGDYGMDTGIFYKNGVFKMLSFCFPKTQLSTTSQWTESAFNSGVTVNKGDFLTINSYYSNKTIISEYLRNGVKIGSHTTRLSDSASNTFSAGSAINREIALAANTPNYAPSQAFFSDAKFFNSTLTTPSWSYVAMNNSTSYERAPYSDTLPAPSKFKYGGYSVTEGNFIADIGSADCR